MKLDKKTKVIIDIKNKLINLGITKNPPYFKFKSKMEENIYKIF